MVIDTYWPCIEAEGRLSSGDVAGAVQILRERLCASPGSSGAHMYRSQALDLAGAYDAERVRGAPCRDEGNSPFVVSRLVRANDLAVAFAADRGSDIVGGLHQRVWMTRRESYIGIRFLRSTRTAVSA
jgi:hypothetical protein